VIARLGLAPHPEGGHYRETWRAEATSGDRPTGTAILYLLAGGERSAWHRVDAAEVWLFHGGDPLELCTANARDTPPVRHVLGAEVVEGQQPQVVVPAGTWQSARSLGSWTLVSCIVSPGFRFEGFELAPATWRPGDPSSRTR
jgi:predicted cupin superfamily sugar epimerase